MRRPYAEQRMRTSEAGREKFCAGCDEWWPVSCFYRNYLGAGGTMNRCKDCYEAYRRRLGIRVSR